MVRNRLDAIVDVLGTRTMRQKQQIRVYAVEGSTGFRTPPRVDDCVAQNFPF